MFKKRRQLTRERDQIVEARTVAKNQLPAEASEAEPGQNTVARLKNQIALFNKQEKQSKEEIKARVKADQQLSQAVDILSPLPGGGCINRAAIGPAETNGFELVRNQRQLSSSAGFDVKEKQPGTSVKGKPGSPGRQTSSCEKPCTWRPYATPPDLKPSMPGW